MALAPLAGLLSAERHRSAEGSRARSRPLRIARRDGFRQAATFAAIGVLSTMAYLILFGLTREVASAQVANAFALVVTAVANTAANRRLTFGIRGRQGLGRDHAAGLLAFGIALAITSLSIATMQAIAPNGGRALEVFVLVAANVLATLVRFVMLRGLVGGPRASAVRFGHPENELVGR